ncbi:MAG TPA: response regulator transcription factor [Luteimonas sp.]
MRVHRDSQPALRIAVVEDDDELREAIVLPLVRDAGYEASGHANALGLYRELLARRVDMVLVDVGLPDEDGYGVVRHLRTVTPGLGIVILSGYRRESDRRRGLDAGADAYLTKPLDPPQLLETLGGLAAGRKSKAVPPPPAQAGNSGWHLEAGGWSLLAPGGVRVRLSLPERQVLQVLAAAGGEAVPREALIAALSDDIHLFDPHRLEMLVHRLRRKCAGAAGEPLPLATLRGIGYALAL